MIKGQGYRMLVKPLDDGEFACELRIDPIQDSKAPPRRKSKPLSTLSGWHLSVAEGYIKRSIKKEGYNSTDLKRSRKSPFKLGEEQGVKFNLVFRAIRDLKKRSKIEEVILGIEEMSREEALYWHSKVEHDHGKGEQRGMKALRILIGGE